MVRSKCWAWKTSNITLVHRLICSWHDGCVQNGPTARREEGAYLNRYVTDEQRSRRPIFNATLRAAASWQFFRVARSTVMIQISALRSRLEKQPTDLRPYASFIRDDALDTSTLSGSAFRIRFSRAWLPLQGRCGGDFLR